jgi:hypothetical protein
MKHAWIVKYMGKGRSASVIVVTGKSNCRLTSMYGPAELLLHENHHENYHHPLTLLT